MLNNSFESRFMGDNIQKIEVRKEVEDRAILIKVNGEAVPQFFIQTLKMFNEDEKEDNLYAVYLEVNGKIGCIARVNEEIALDIIPRLAYKAFRYKTYMRDEGKFKEILNYEHEFYKLKTL